jgi:hypothetical protein
VWDALLLVWTSTKFVLAEIAIRLLQAGQASAQFLGKDEAAKKFGGMIEGLQKWQLELSDHANAIAAGTVRTQQATEAAGKFGEAAKGAADGAKGQGAAMAEVAKQAEDMAKKLGKSAAIKEAADKAAKSGNAALAAELTKQAAAAETAEKKALALANALKRNKEEAEAAKTAAAQYAAEIKKMGDEMSGVAAGAEADKLMDALNSIKGEVAGIESGFEGENLKKWASQFAEVGSVLSSMPGRVAAGAAGLAILNRYLAEQGGLANASAEALQFYIDTADRLGGDTDEALIEQNTRQFIEDVRAAAKEWKVAGDGWEMGPTLDELGVVVDTTDDFTQALDVAKNAMEVLGIAADSVLGRLIGGMAAAVQAGSALKNALSTTNADGTVKKRDWFGAAQAGLQGIGAIWQGTNARTGGQRVLGGAAAGAAAGSAFGGVGALVGGALGAIVGLFRKPAWAKAATEAGKVFGTKVSDELAKAIQANSKKLGISLKNASLLALPDVMAEAGGDPRKFGAQALQLLDAIKSGAVPAAEGLKSLGEGFSKIAEEAARAGSVGDRAMVGIIKRARELGIEVPEIKEYVRGQLDSAAGGVAGMVSGINLVSPEGAAAQATIFAAAFWAKVKEDGIIAAAEAFGPAFDEIEKKLSEGGFDVSAIFAPVREMMALSSNELFAGAAQGAAGLNDALKGLANSGYMTADSFAAFGNQARAAYDQAREGGASHEQALQVIAPLLSSMASTAANYSMALDPATASLIEQAKVAGIAFPVEPVDRMVAAIDRLTQALGGDVPAAANSAQNALNGLHVPDVGGGGGGQYASPGEAPQNMAAGGYVPARAGGTLVRLAERGEGEYVVPESAAGGGVAVNLNVSVGAGGGTSEAEVAKLVEQIIEQVRRNRGGLVTEIREKLGSRKRG